jgi:hypothetical protein
MLPYIRLNLETLQGDKRHPPAPQPLPGAPGSAAAAAGAGTLLSSASMGRSAPAPAPALTSTSSASSSSAAFSAAAARPRGIPTGSAAVTGLSPGLAPAAAAAPAPAVTTAAAPGARPPPPQPLRIPESSSQPPSRPLAPLSTNAMVPTNDMGGGHSAKSLSQPMSQPQPQQPSLVVPGPAVNLEPSSPEFTRRVTDDAVGSRAAWSRVEPWGRGSRGACRG